MKKFTLSCFTILLIAFVSFSIQAAPRKYQVKVTVENASFLGVTQVLLLYNDGKPHREWLFLDNDGHAISSKISNNATIVLSFEQVDGYEIVLKSGAITGTISNADFETTVEYQQPQ